MHMLSVRPYKAKEQQCCVDTEEASVTFDPENTNIDFCLAVFTSRIKKVFYTYVCKLHFMSFIVFYLCFPAVSLFVLFCVLFCKNQNVCKPLDLRALPLGWTSERRSVFSVFLIYLVP